MLFNFGVVGLGLLAAAAVVMPSASAAISSRHLLRELHGAGGSESSTSSSGSAKATSSEPEFEYDEDGYIIGFKDPTNVDEFISISNCSSTSAAAASHTAVDAHVEAILQMGDKLCSNFDGDLTELVRPHTGKGLVAATALVNVTAACEAEGHAEGCTTASAQATAWAEASASAVAEASFRALKNCQCKGAQGSHETFSVAAIENRASEFKKILAEANAQVDLTVCVDEEVPVSTALAFAECNAERWSLSIAKATAGLAIEGGCLDDRVSTTIVEQIAQANAAILSKEERAECIEDVLKHGNVTVEIVKNATTAVEEDVKKRKEHEEALKKGIAL